MSRGRWAYCGMAARIGATVAFLSLGSGHHAKAHTATNPLTAASALSAARRALSGPQNGPQAVKTVWWRDSYAAPDSERGAIYAALDFEDQERLLGQGTVGYAVLSYTPSRVVIQSAGGTPWFVSNLVMDYQDGRWEWGRTQPMFTSFMFPGVTAADRYGAYTAWPR